MKKVLLVTPMMPPTAGGPATHAKKLIEYFGKGGGGYAAAPTTLLSFEKYKKFPSGIRHALLFLEILLKSLNKKTILALDGFTVALPSILAAKILRKKIIIRIGGDFIYEQFLYTKEVTLEDFYTNFNHLKKLFSHTLYLKYLVQKFVLQNADEIIFNTSWQKDIFDFHYKLSENKRVTHLILNPLEQIPPDIYNSFPYEINSHFIFTSITRDIPYKNQKRLVSAFELAIQSSVQNDKKTQNELYLETAQGSWESCLKRISLSRAYICASISDISPNQVFEAVALDIPVIITKYSGITEMLASAKIARVVDPFSLEDMKNAILEMCDETKYQMYKENIKKFNWPQTWESLFKQYQEILDR